MAGNSEEETKRLAGEGGGEELYWWVENGGGDPRGVRLDGKGAKKGGGEGGKREQGTKKRSGEG